MLRLSYEADIATDPTVGYRRICEFLNLTPQDDASVSYAPLNPFPLSSIITNFPEVRQTLRGTRYEWMLEE